MKRSGFPTADSLWKPGGFRKHSRTGFASITSAYIPINEPLETVEGTLERIICFDEENHYTVAQLLPANGAL
jgi:hypothetical protein